jgi:hypothetical protein
VSVVAVEARLPGSIDELILTDELPAISVGARDGAIHQLVEHLGVARGIQRIHEELRRNSTGGFRYPVSIAVVDIDDCAPG